MPKQAADSVLRVLFISRAFPPVIGGIEQQNLEVSRALGELCAVSLIVNRHGKRFLPLFLPYALFRALLAARRVDVILLGDGVLAVVGYLLKLLTGRPVACIIHGLDITYPNRTYQRLWTGFFIPRLDRLIAVGNETIRRGTSLGIDEQLFRFIPNGVSQPRNTAPTSRRALEELAGRALPGTVMLTLGRLVKRKGVAWFIEHVMPTLDPGISYLVVGTGRDEQAIRDAIEHSGTAGRVLFLGQVSGPQKCLLFESADIFVQPNIAVAGDMEGFGMVVLEAAAHGLPVLAARLEGLQDAIVDGQSGVLVTSGDPAAFRNVIHEWHHHPQQRRQFGAQARAYVLANCTWHAVARQYLAILESLA
jgi:glycosyltransferase involved in cell wall biosynthesis